MSLAPVCYYCNTTAQCQTDVTANETSRSAAAQPSGVGSLRPDSGPSLHRCNQTSRAGMRQQESRELARETSVCMCESGTDGEGSLFFFCPLLKIC